MELTDRQRALLSVALTSLYDQMCKDGTTPEMKKEIQELSNLIVKNCL
jgi:hypothetical protein